MECNICQEERQRRCCVLKRDNAELFSKWVAEPFANAPFLHPFRHPSFHAAQLRALILQKVTTDVWYGWLHMTEV
eukprot:10598946-Karenia_brevis.AAC.1